MPIHAALLRSLIPVARDILLQRPRSLHADALALTAAAKLSLKVQGRTHLPAQGPFLLVTNHYTRPGFGVWWTGLALSATLPMELHWIITAGWTGTPLEPLSRWLLRRVAQVYGLTAMPPMPPNPEEEAERAAAVRRVVAYARRSKMPVVAVTPEGRDFPGSRLGQPPPGAGRFLLYLQQILGTIIPAGVYEEDQCLCLNFGQPFKLDLPLGLAHGEQDLLASRQVMAHVSALVPPHMRSDG
jgi:1-acyl-sn-glycerol-3-phosphate acyltransferase